MKEMDHSSSTSSCVQCDQPKCNGIPGPKNESSCVNVKNSHQNGLSNGCGKSYAASHTSLVNGSETACVSSETFEPTDSNVLAEKLSQCDITFNEEVTCVQYQSELQMPDIMRLIQKDLSEPYSIYTYRYFIHNWPKLCFLVRYLFFLHVSFSLTKICFCVRPCTETNVWVPLFVSWTCTKKSEEVI